MIGGLAVGIDYALFIVSRNREERHKGLSKLDAIGRSGATANRAVFFSGLTVVLALAGMLIVPTTIFRSLAGGAIIVVLVSVAASMTLLPSLLALFGDWVNWPWLRRGWTYLAFVVMAGAFGAVFAGLDAVGAPFFLALLGGLATLAAVGILLTRFVRGSSAERPRGTQREGEGQAMDSKGSSLSTDGGFWDRTTKRVMARPWVWLVTAAGFMIVLSLPYWFQAHPDGEGRREVETGLAGISSLPDEVQAKQAFNLLIEEFPQAGLQSAAEVVMFQGGVDEAHLASLAEVVGRESTVRGTPSSRHERRRVVTARQDPARGSRRGRAERGRHGGDRPSSAGPTSRRCSARRPGNSRARARCSSVERRRS